MMGNEQCWNMVEIEDIVHALDPVSRVREDGDRSYDDVDENMIGVG